MYSADSAAARWPQMAKGRQLLGVLFCLKTSSPKSSAAFRSHTSLKNGYVMMKKLAFLDFNA
jgi:hypothetical protein